MLNFRIRLPQPEQYIPTKREWEREPFGLSRMDSRPVQRTETEGPNDSREVQRIPLRRL